MDSLALRQALKDARIPFLKEFEPIKVLDNKSESGCANE